MSTLDTTPGVEVIGGSLGHGLGAGVGHGARACGSTGRRPASSSSSRTARCRRARPGRRRWRPAISASTTWSPSSTATASRPTARVVLDMEPVADKWRAFGWDDGRDRRQRHGGHRRGASRRARAQRPAQGDRAAHPARQGRADASSSARRPTSSASTPREWDGMIADFESEGEIGDERARRTLAMGAGRGVGRPRRPSMRRSAGRWWRSGRDAAGHRRPDRRPRQVHRHPAVPRRLSRSASSTSAWPSRTCRGRRRAGAHRQDPLRHDLRRLRHPPRLRLHRDRAAPTAALNVKIVAGLPGLTTGYGGTHQAIEDLALMRMIPGSS